MADHHDLMVLNLPYNRGDILTVVGHRPVRAVLPRCAVSGEIDHHYGVLRLQNIELRIPVVRIA